MLVNKRLNATAHNPTRIDTVHKLAENELSAKLSENSVDRWLMIHFLFSSGESGSVGHLEQDWPDFTTTREIRKLLGPNG